MKCKLLSVIFVLFVLAGAIAWADQSIALLEVSAPEMYEVKSQIIHEYMEEFIKERGSFSIVNISPYMPEMDLADIDKASVLNAGKLSGAEFILVYELATDESDLFLSADIILSESGDVISSTFQQMEGSEDLASLVKKAVAGLIDEAGNIPPVPKWLSKAVGTYQSVIFSNYTPYPGTTRIFLNSEGKLQGEYVFIENGTRITGILWNFSTFPPQGLKCMWKDTYGKGDLEMTFNKDLTQFNGFWSIRGETGRFRWNGMKM